MKTLSPDALRLDCAPEIARIENAIRRQVAQTLRRRGAVIGLSGGIDSTLVAALCAQALGKDRVVGLIMPEKESSPESTDLGMLAADFLGIRKIVEDITPILEGTRCYERRDEAILKCVPEYAAGYRAKIVLPGLTDDERLRVFSIVVQSPNGHVIKKRMSADVYLAVIASSNFKQRTRKMMEYHHADRLNYAVAGTPNRLEYELGFFVKNGDGAADFKPIAHLYKTQVYQLADYLGLPEAIRVRTSTTDTYPLPQSQEEFYFSIPFEKMDLCLYAHSHKMKPGAVGPVIDLTVEQVKRIYRDIEAKRRAASYGHLAPLLVETPR
jgi:NAD+ synthase